VWSSAAPSYARPEGITGYSGKQGDSCSDSANCHAGGPGTLPIVELDGPPVVAADAIVTFHFTVHSQSSRQVVAGFNVAASGGELMVLANQDERLEGDELTHQAPKPDVDAVASWAFTWRAPLTAGAYTLYGAGMSANGNGSRNGDDSATTTLRVRVAVGPIGDANCDATLSAADVTAVLLRLRAGTAGACAGNDVTGDGHVDYADLSATTAALFAQ
jgi:hypothetical protein